MFLFKCVTDEFGADPEGAVDDDEKEEADGVVAETAEFSLYV